MDDGEAPVRKTYLEKIGRQILRLRLYRGWSQAELARRSNLSQSTVSRLERGVQQGISLGRLTLVMKALTVGDVTFDRPPTPPQTNLELMLRGDPWLKASNEADRRLGWPQQAPQRRPTRFAWEADDDDADEGAAGLGSAG